MTSRGSFRGQRLENGSLPGRRVSVVAAWIVAKSDDWSATRFSAATLLRLRSFLMAQDTDDIQPSIRLRSY